MLSSRAVRWRYAMLGFPLAFVGLPLYLFVPKYFSETYAVDLAIIGAILLALRIGDMIIDPLIGVISDKYRHQRVKIMTLGGIGLALSYGALFWPALIAPSPLVVFAILTALVYIAYSTLNINYYAHGLGYAHDEHERTQLSAAREGLVLCGTLAASLLPAIMLQNGYVLLQAMQASAAALAITLVIGLIIQHRLPPPRPDDVELENSHLSDFVRLFREHPRLKILYLLFFVNALPTATGSSLFLFYCDDVLGREDQAGYFLAVYFICAAISTPLWERLAYKIGKDKALLAGMILAIVGFSWTYTLTAETAGLFFIICAMAGFALGADMVLLPALLADALEDDTHHGSLSFALWQAISKWSLALATGLALPLLAYVGYQPHAGGTSAESQHWLTIGYALIPCLIKIGSLILVWRIIATSKARREAIA